MKTWKLMLLQANVSASKLSKHEDIRFIKHVYLKLMNNLHFSF